MCGKPITWGKEKNFVEWIVKKSQIASQNKELQNTKQISYTKKFLHTMKSRILVTSSSSSSSSLGATTSEKFWPSQGIFSIWGGF
jgi:hypothetical protein